MGGIIPGEQLLTGSPVDAGMRILVTLTIVVLLATPSLASACGSKRGRTLDRNKVIRVYLSDRPEDGRYQACLEPRGRPMALVVGGGADFYSDLQNLRLAGRFVAYSYVFENRYGGAVELTVNKVDVRRRRVDESVRFYWGPGPGATRDAVALHGMRLMRDGGFGFIVGRGRARDDVTLPVSHHVWANGRVVDSGTGIDLSSFRAVPGGIGWRHDGQAMTATL
jgi:hypothetical protein